MLILVLLLAVGLALLCFGGDWLARGAASLALKWNISPVVVGLTIVAVATSMPEMIAGFFAAAQGADGIVIGNLVGSNLGNMGLILGAAALIFPIRIQRRMIRQEVPILLVVTLIFTYVGLPMGDDEAGALTRVEAFFLLAGAVMYVLFIVRQALARRGKGALDDDEMDEALSNPIQSQWKCLAWVIAGGAGLAAGAELMVGSAQEMAGRLGVSDGLVGLTIVAIGTSLPELAASFAAALRKQSDLIAGNIVGSNIFNMLLIGGGVGVVYPISVDSEFYQVSYPSMLLMTILLWLAFFTGRRVTRVEGGLLVGLYFVVLVLAWLAQTGRLW